MKAILVLTYFWGSLALADDHKHSYQINGMHCGGCVKNVEREVCSMEGVENCKATLINEKKKIGKVEFTVKPGFSVPADKVKDVVVNKVGYEFAGDYKEPAKSEKSKGKVKGS